GDSTIALAREIYSTQQNTIYPNPFEEFFIVNSLENDVFILQSIDGTIIGNYKVIKGETRISKNLPKGIYIGTLLNQNQTFKIVKL
ncbi:MAG TPA: T9SS type A sorting domain-containing protein, partial [Chitinophagaceae bacterium]|nr:T9SS type A sorting domain-containing protein [Chitinophagaceae bacterium]